MKTHIFAVLLASAACLTHANLLPTSIVPFSANHKDSWTVVARDAPSLSLNLPAITPVSLDLPSITPVSIPPVSIAPISIPAVSIPPVSISPLSLNLPAQCTPTIKPDKNGYVPPGECDALWNYSPSFMAALTFAILFAVLLSVHIAQAIIWKNSYCWVVCMASAWELISYITRTMGSRNQQSSALATVSQITVLVAPVWVNAFAYMVFARLVHVFAPNGKVWIFTPSSLAMIFVTLDIIAFTVQLIGGGMAGPGSDAATAKRGINIYMCGIGVQEAFVIIFSTLIVRFVRNKTRAEKIGQPRQGQWRSLIYALCLCLTLISVRIVFRLVEFSGGMSTDNPVPYNEKYFYAFEAAPMLFAIGVWNVVHPGRVIRGQDSKLPRSWLSEKICVRRGIKGLGSDKGRSGDHVRLVDRDLQEYQRWR